MVDEDDEALCRELLRALLGGDEPGAWTAVDRLSRDGGLAPRIVAAVARGFGAGEATREDVMQDLRRKLLRWKPETFRKSAQKQVSGWISVAARNALIDRLRKDERLVGGEAAEDAIGAAQSPTHPRADESLDRHQDLLDVQVCRDDMPPGEERRLADVLLAVRDMTALEIAHAIGLIDAATLAELASRPRPPHGKRDDRVRVENTVDTRVKRVRKLLRECSKRRRMVREVRASLLRQADAGRAR